MSQDERHRATGEGGTYLSTFSVGHKPMAVPNNLRAHVKSCLVDAKDGATTANHASEEKDVEKTQ